MKEIPLKCRALPIIQYLIALTYIAHLRTIFLESCCTHLTNHHQSLPQTVWPFQHQGIS